MLETLIWLVPLNLLALVYVGGPLWSKFTVKMHGRLILDRLDPMLWPPDVAETMRRHEHDLHAMGFEISDRFTLPDAGTESVSCMVTIFVHRQSGDRAMLTAMWFTDVNPWKLGTLYLEFSTRFEEGLCFNTLNSSVLSAFIVPSTTIKTQVPQVQEAAQLFRIHRYLIAKYGAKGRKFVYPPGGADKYLAMIWRQSFEQQVRLGHCIYHEATDTFGTTFSGAFATSHCFLWPMSWIRRAKMMNKARAIVAEVERNSDAATLARRHAP